MDRQFEIKNELITKYHKTDGIFAAIYGILGFLFVRFFLFYDWRTNFEFALKLYTIAYTAVVYSYAKAKGKTIPKESFFWICVLFVISYLFKIEYFFILLCRIGVAAYFTAVTGGLFRGGTSGYIAVDLINTFIILPFGNFFSVFPALFALFGKRDKKEKQPVSPAVWGVLLAVAAMWFILPLLTRADSNFLSGTTDFISHFFAGFDSAGFIDIIVMSVFALPVTCYLFGLGYGSISKETDHEIKENIITSRENARISPALTVKVFLYIVCAVYLLFIGLQANYLLGAFTGRLYGGMTYAQYARTGFFELVKVSAINLTILALCNLITVKTEENGTKPTKLVLSVLSLLLLSTATAKMVMYICAYGLTFKRIVSSVFLIWLMVVFALCIARLYRTFNLTKTAVVTGAVMFCVMFSFDISLHRYKFNTKYGFEEKIPQIEYSGVYNSLILPDIEDVTVIEITDSDGNFYKEIPAKGEIIDLLKASVDTEKVSVQDFPYADFYYSLHIHHISVKGGDSEITTVYIYQDGDYFYIEQPYYLICRTGFDWNSILMPYRA